MSSKFTEQETESYYDGQDEIYRSVWDEEGSVPLTTTPETIS